MEKENKLTLEQSFSQLEEIIGSLEKEQSSLEESFQLYKKGMDLLKQCHEELDEIEKKIIVLNENGETHEFQ